jgi:hypothetical protein
MRRWIRRAAWALVAVVALVGAGAGVLVWRVRRGPLPLDVFIPRFEAALAADPSWQVHLDGLDLVWAAEGHRTELRARGVAIARPADGAAFRLDEVRVRLNRRALVRGSVVVTGIEVDEPAIRLVRDPSGRLALELGTPATGARDVGWATTALDRLEHVAVRGGRITVVDEATATTWTLPHVDADAWPGPDAWRLQLAFTVASDTTAIPVWVDATYLTASGTFELQLSSPGADTGAALAVWPASLATPAHAWVMSHVKDGRIQSTVLAVSGRFAADGERRLALDGFDASLAFDGLSVRWLDAMPPVTGVGGTMRFGRDHLDATVERGSLERLQVGPAAVHVAWPPNVPPRLAVDARVRGPLAALAGVLDHEPIALGERVSFRTRGLEGTSTTRVHVAFPLEPRPTFGKLGLRARATIADPIVPGLAGDWDVGGGAVEVVVDDHALAIDGTAVVRGIPLELHYRDRFGHAASRRLEVAARLETKARRALGLDASPWLDGPVDGRLRLVPRADGRMAADVDVDLAPATVDVPALALRKEPGAPGRFAAQLTLARGLVASVEHFEASAGAVTVRGKAGRAAGGGTWNSVDGTAAFVLPDRPDADALVEVALRAQDRGWQLNATSREAGPVLRAYGYENARGGKLAIDATIAAADATEPSSVRVTLEDVTLSRVPWLVKVVSLASIRGLLDVGSQQTVAVDRAVMTAVATSPQTFEIRDAVARGPQLGLKLAGTVDRERGELDLRGTLIPSYYWLNEGADRIPVIGPVLEMATGGALQGVDFTVRGSRADPVVTVQPISSLAPGMLREWLKKVGW